MTEHDSGSSSDASAESSSSSGPDSSSGGSGIDLSPILQHILDDVLESRRSSPIGPPLPPEGERERRAQYEKTLKEILFSNEPIPDRTSLVRKIVEGERWFLPTAPDGQLERLAGTDPRVQRALSRPLVAGQPERRAARGSRPPVDLVVAMTADPGRPARQLTGRELARAVPPDASGAIFSFDAGAAADAVALRREELPLLTRLADSLDLERILIEPGPCQVEALQAARWYVPAANEKLAPSPPGWGHPAVTLYTHPDRAGAEANPLVELDGLTLCTRLANRGDYVKLSDLSALTPRTIDLGESQTKILCAGLLARKLYDQDHWSPSGWFASRQERLRAAQLAGWAYELLKLIPPGRDRLPRSSIRSIEGATFLHSRPEFRDRAWIERQHQRHTRSASRRFNSR